MNCFYFLRIVVDDGKRIHLLRILLIHFCPTISSVLSDVFGTSCDQYPRRSLWLNVRSINIVVGQFPFNFNNFNFNLVSIVLQ